MYVRAAAAPGLPMVDICNLTFTSLIGQGVCHSFLQGMINTEACGYDGGDCTVDAEIFSTSVPTDFATEESTGETTEESSFNVVQPSPDLYPNCTISSLDDPYYPKAPEIGNGYCDFPMNNVECGFDGGDCDVFNDRFPNCRPNRSDPTWIEIVKDFPSLEYWWPYFLKDGACDPYCKYSLRSFVQDLSI